MLTSVRDSFILIPYIIFSKSYFLKDISSITDFYAPNFTLQKQYSICARRISSVFYRHTNKMKKIADEIICNGKCHLSLRSAARVSGYHRDYLGQMIRAEKLLGVRIGRSYYIERGKLSEFLRHKEQVQKHGPPLFRRYGGSRTPTHAMSQRAFFARFPQYAALTAILILFIFVLPLLVRTDTASGLSSDRVFRYSDIVSEYARAAMQKEFGNVSQIAAQNIEYAVTPLAKNSDELWKTIASVADGLAEKERRRVWTTIFGAVKKQRELITPRLTETTDNISVVYAGVARYFREPVMASRNSFASLPALFQDSVKEAARRLHSPTGAFFSAEELVLHIPTTLIGTFRQIREDISSFSEISPTRKVIRRSAVSPATDSRQYSWHVVHSLADTISRADRMLSNTVQNATSVLAPIFQRAEKHIPAPSSDSQKSDALEVEDILTGDIFCMRIFDGGWDKRKGTCGETLMYDKTNNAFPDTPMPHADSIQTHDARTTTSAAITAPALDIGNAAAETIATTTQNTDFITP